MKYHGEIFDDGNDWMAIDSDRATGPIVSVKVAVEAMTAEFLIDASQAREIARHLNAAADLVLNAT